jgi:predicted porin
MSRNKNFLTLTAIALAVSAAVSTPAMAQSSVTISGVVDVGVNSSSGLNFGTGIGTVHTTSMVGGGLETSYLEFAGSEDLGDGMKSGFALGTFFQPNSGADGRTFLGAGAQADTFFSRDANVWLSGSAGKVTLGRQISPMYLSTLLFDPFGGSFDFSPIVYQTYATYSAGNTLSADTGYSNAISYSTPDFSGLSATFLYSLSGESGTKGSFSANALYFHGPLAATVAYENTTVGNINANDTFALGGAYPVGTTENTFKAGISYDFNPVKVFFQADRNSTDVPHLANLALDTYQIGATVAAGQGSILAAYAHTNGSADHKTFSIGYDYNMSKRTDLYTAYMNDKAAGFVDAVGNSYTNTSFSVGIRHHF